MSAAARSTRLFSEVAPAEGPAMRSNFRLIRLYEKHGYAITDSGMNGEHRMVRLTKALDVA